MLASPLSEGKALPDAMSGQHYRGADLLSAGVMPGKRSALSRREGRCWAGAMPAVPLSEGNTLPGAMPGLTRQTWRDAASWAACSW
jgi:hypothetical protein